MQAGSKAVTTRRSQKPPFESMSVYSRQVPIVLEKTGKSARKMEQDSMKSTQVSG
jgi:hypothetical protein